jgi:hypothetical protein
MPRLVLAASARPVVGVDKSNAHEFWIAPEAYRAAGRGRCACRFAPGRGFPRVARSYAPENFERFEVVTSEGAIPVDGRTVTFPR